MGATEEIKKYSKEELVEKILEIENMTDDVEKFQLILQSIDCGQDIDLSKLKIAIDGMKTKLQESTQETIEEPLIEQIFDVELHIKNV
ncbi:MAG: hypothetical protein LBJ09_02905 [Clostridiales bacterium]|nr:hypothetical protein [Clostridiales bacterium]